MSQINVRWKNQKPLPSMAGIHNLLHSVDRTTPGGFRMPERRWTKGAVFSYAMLIAGIAMLTWLGMHK